MTRDEPPGYALPLLLLGGFRLIIDALHRDLAEQGHPDVRPVHGFALQAIGRETGTVSDLARKLGVSKQAAAKTVAALEKLGYVRRDDDPDDRRSQQLRLTSHGTEVLTLSAEALARVHAAWTASVGTPRLRALEEALSTVLSGTDLPNRIDLPGWLGSP